ncbi:conserved hypothetical protein [Exiguobacterium sp. 8H]|uniref:DUF1281 family ferredoxin-like fold protein n=1 Tax=Exiguobacterium sp. 8H TaxID=2653140 RepID=UPI0012F3613F|nr:hypothetical protein [Exiguobacterium sp. 8H]VXB38844.1 conserved hypothetical protein [Exiguobacterium sp. 8H]
MPNWCNNTLHVIGFEDEGEIETFLEEVGDERSPFSFARIVPLPCDGHDNFVAYEIWGTKWEPTDVDFTDRYTDRVVFDFLTAWSPPLPVIGALSVRFPHLRFVLRYAEYGIQFAGEAHYTEGKELYHNEYTPEQDIFGYRGFVRAHFFR